MMIAAGSLLFKAEAWRVPYYLMIGKWQVAPALEGAEV